MGKKSFILGLAFSIGTIGMQSVSAQPANNPPAGVPKPTPEAAPKISAALAKNLEQSGGQNANIPRERREEAYARLLEGQRYVWNMTRRRAPGGNASTGGRMARQSLLRALELNPNLSEAYTALAELTLQTPPYDIDEAEQLARLSVRINPDSFGSRRILARIYTIKSGLGGGAGDTVASQKAVVEWKEVTRLDPRNAEAWAFLSEFYERQNKSDEHITALRQWIAAPPPLETGFYNSIFRSQSGLSGENASLKLGEALLKTGKESEAVEILSQMIADDPENLEAIELLRRAVENADAESSAKAVDFLRQAVYANPTNGVLNELLVQLQSRLGKTNEAAESLRASIKELAGRDKKAAANLQISLGDVLSEANKTDESIKAYEEALKMYGVGEEPSALNTDIDREFATRVFEKIIRVYKNANRLDEARTTIERARQILGRNDLFADQQLISLLSETGKKPEALQIVRTLRAKMPTDYSLLRLEATLLTDLGKPDEGAALVRALIGKGRTLSAPSLMYDDFSNFIFISGLYSQARRGKEAALAAQQAYRVADGEERRQIANLSLATAQQQSGDFKAAEETLRSLLRQNPGNPIALNNLGYFLVERNERLTEALSLIEQAVKIDPTNSSYLDSLGWAYFKLGKLTEAERYIKQALRYNPTSATINEHLGDIFQKQNNPDLAAAAWRKALLLSTDSADAARLKSKLSAQISKQ